MYKLLESSITQGAEFADLYYLEKTQDSINFANNKLTDISSKNIPGFTLQVKKDGKVGVVSASSDRHEEVIQTALNSSLEGEVLDYDFNHPTTLPDRHLTNDALWEQSFEKYVSDGERLIQLILDYDSTLNVGINIRREREIKGYINTYGCDYINTIDRFAMLAGAQLIQDSSILEINDLCLSNGNNYNIDQIADSLIQQIKLGRIEKTINSGKMPIILSPRAVSQMTYAIVIGLSGEKVRQGISPLTNRLGQQIFSEKITLIDDMLMPNGIDSSLIDDEGTPAERTILYENGVLKNYLLNLCSAHALGVPSNGKGQRRGMWNSRNYAAPVAPWFSNLIMEPGNASFEEMLSEIKEGLVIDSMIGMIMSNLLAGAIDSDIDMAYKVENGKLVGRVKNAAIGINIYDVLKNQVVALENQLHKTTNDLDSISLLPHMLLKDINITV